MNLIRVLTVMSIVALFVIVLFTIYYVRVYKSYKAGKKKRAIIAAVALPVALCVIAVTVWASFIRFTIKGKWVKIEPVQANTGDLSAMLEAEFSPSISPESDVIVFTDKECNFYGPADVYAFYKEGEEWILRITETISGHSHAYTVMIRDRNLIELYDGENMFKRLQRVK